MYESRSNRSTIKIKLPGSPRFSVLFVDKRASCAGYLYTFHFARTCSIEHPLTGDQPAERSLPIHRTTQTQTKRKQTLMP
jgi:hypothetical protein